MAAEKENMSVNGASTCYRGREKERKRKELFVKFGLYYLRFGKDEALFQTNL